MLREPQSIARSQSFDDVYREIDDEGDMKELGPQVLGSQLYRARLNGTRDSRGSYLLKLFWV